MNKILKMSEVQSNIDDIKMNLAELKDKTLAKSFYTLLKIQENPDFILVTTNIDKVNELADDDENFVDTNVYLN